VTVSRRFQGRVDDLFRSQQNRARTKKGPSDRITKAGYDLPFNKPLFSYWFLEQFDSEDAAIRCKYCKRPIDAYSCTVDHEIPLKRGGSPGLENLGLTCEGCNQCKGGLTPDEFRFFLAKMEEMSLHFHSGIAVADITSRLQKAVKLAAAMRFNIVKQQKQAAAVVLGAQSAPAAEEPF